MLKPLSLFIGLRYTRAKRRNNFISFISLASMLGIALGVMVLITVLSVMNGFDHQIKTRVFSMANQVTVGGSAGVLDDWQTLAKRVERFPDVVGSAPMVSGEGMLSKSGLVFPSAIIGILPKQQQAVSSIAQRMVKGSLNDLKAGQFGIVLGETLAFNLGVQVGGMVTVITPQATLTPVGVMPRFKRFKVVGIFHVGGNVGFDTKVAYINLNDAQALFNLNQGISGLRLKVTNLYQAPRLAALYQQKLGPSYHVSNWTDEFGAFFKAIQMEKTMMFLILALIIAVAAFNLVSSLVMAVNDKRADIAILRTLGARRQTIMAIFVIQGALIGFMGTLLGLVSGVILSLNVTRLVSWIQEVFHVNLVSSAIYFVNYLPSKLEWTDVLHVCIIALILSLLATLYPAWQAFRTQPAQALRYE